MGPRPTGVDGRVGPAAAVTKPMQSKHFHSLLAYKSVSFRGGAWLLALIFRGGEEEGSTPPRKFPRPTPPPSSMMMTTTTMRMTR